ALGVALLALDQAAEAEDAMLSGLASHPDHPALSLLLGHARTALEKTDQARVDYGKFRRQAAGLVAQADELVLTGRLVEAEHAYGQLISTDGDNAAAHAGLGRLLLRLKRPAEALPALERALELNPQDHNSQHFIGLARGEPGERAEPAYVQALFDDYADEFESHLTEELGYRIPEEMAERLLDYQADLSRVLDLGCGTGLMAEALADRFEKMDGVDLSPRMLKQARASGRYASLSQNDVVNYLRKADQRWSTVLAADVLVYVGELEPLVEPLAKRLESGGWFAFSIELSAGETCLLDPATGRFRHHPDGVDKLLIKKGFSAPRWSMTTIRQEMGKRIPGAIGLAQRL
ncbi:MAG: methyltransferase domain-containing protein, partial [Pseudomonadota bacterium]